MIKLATAFVLVLFLLLSFLIQTGRASTSNQTIPTAPPPTVEIPTITPVGTATSPPATIEIPTISSTRAPTYPPQITIIYTQPTQVLGSQTPGFTTSPTIETIPSAVPTTTGLLKPGTIPILTATLSSTGGTQISPTSTLLPSATVLPTTNAQGSRGILFCLLGGGIVLIFVVGIVWFLKSRNK